ncbi:MAG TPA: HAD family hydrolase [Acidimicrobiales bacterium]|nr:HAD family hydrolase [Acidimicrobiales bacterium]
MNERRVVCLDMAGTTVSDGGAVMESFRAGLQAGAIPEGGAQMADALDYARRTMGQSKIEVFRAVLGDEGRAQSALSGFEKRWDELLGQGRITALPGAVEAMARLRDAGVGVALLTGFPRSVQDTIIAVLGWHDAADLTVCPEDAGRGRPWPDMVLWSALRLEASAMSAVTVAGDTASDVESARRAGAGVAAGVLTGTAGADELRAAGATHILPSVAQVAALVLDR